MGRTVAQCTAKGIPAKYAQPKLNKMTWLNNPFSSMTVNGSASTIFYTVPEY